jgi:hypothetical protein
MKRLYVSLLLGFLLMPVLASAGAVITYHGRILDIHDVPVEASSVVFKISIYSSNSGKCLLYEETRTISMAGTQGVFVIPIGDGVGSRTAADPGFTVEEAFSNNPNANFDRALNPKFTCNSGTTYVAQPLDQRQLKVTFNDQSGTGDQQLPILDVGFVPLAVNSLDAQNIGGVPSASVLKVSGGAASAFTPANFAELVKIINGTTTQYAKVNQLNGSTLPSMSANQVLGWNGSAWTAVTPLTSYTETDPSVKSFAKANLPACSAGQYLRNDGSGNLVCSTPAGGGGSGTVTSVAAGTGILTDQTGNAAITSSGTVSVDVGTGANQIVQMGSDAKLPVVDGSKLTNIAAATAVTASGLTSTATISTSGNISTSGTLTATTISNTNLYTDNLYVRSPAAGGNNIRITGPTTPIASSYILRLPESLPATGTTRVLASDDAGNLSWAVQSAGSVTSVTGQAPIVIDSSSASAPKVTLPKATASVDGYLDKADFATFNSKQAAGNYVVTLQGDVTSSNYSAGTVDVAVNKIKGVPVSAAPTLAGQVLRYESGSLVPSYISMLDLRSKIDGSLALSTSCGTNKTLTFNSATDSLKCENISITKSQISDLGTIGSLAAKNAVDLNSSDVTGTLPIANGGTGATTAAGARAALSLGTAALSSTGSVAGAVPLLGTGGLTADKMCVADSTGASIICNTTVPTSTQWSNGASNAIYYNTGNVGIGVTTPTMSLDVNSGSGNNFRIVYSNDAARAASFTLNNNGDLTVATANTRPLYLNPSGGNIGVGTSNPLAKLDVNGAVAVSGTTVIDANGYPKLKVVTEDDDCSTIGVGAIAVDSAGNVLSCQP